MNECPIQKEALYMVQTGREFVQAVRKLRRSLRRCGRCEAADGCPILAQIDAAIDAALQEVSQEWNFPRMANDG
jgi:hypothetical protein